MSDFDLDRSRWYNVMKVGMSCDHIAPCVAEIIKRAPILAYYSYEAVIGQKLAKCEEQLAAALDAMKAAREEYEARPHKLVAAE